MKKLRSVELLMWNAEEICWNSLLQARSCELLEGLKLYWKGPSCILSRNGLLYLASGPIRRSLINCEIEARVFRDNEQLRQSLIRCFDEEVEPMFEKRQVGIRTLLINVL
mmetsp:Transcript_24999/g.62553  ORF Transcript_24999/g.62553 Transcript_24999/m.62553 type:complete len:110 (-) Transcript_24999:66-395(-)